MDRAQLLNDLEEGLRLSLDGRQSSIWTATPGIIQSVDLAAMTCSVQPAIKGVIEDENGATQSVALPLLTDVPICFPSGGGFLITFPLAVNDEVLVVFGSRCIDSWWQSGGVQKPVEARMHDLSDGFAIPGPRSTPNVASGISTTAFQLRNLTGTSYISIEADGKFKMLNATTSLKTVLSDLESLLNTFMAALAALSPGAVTGTMLSVPAAASVSSLAAVLVKIGALLE